MNQIGTDSIDNEEKIVLLDGIGRKVLYTEQLENIVSRQPSFVYGEEGRTGYIQKP